jgi:hypothetical protein
MQLCAWMSDSCGTDSGGSRRTHRWCTTKLLSWEINRSPVTFCFGFCASCQWGCFRGLNHRIVLMSPKEAELKHADEIVVSLVSMGRRD